jgi:hypothetical protein
VQADERVSQLALGLGEDHLDGRAGDAAAEVAQRRGRQPRLAAQHLCIGAEPPERLEEVEQNKDTDRLLDHPRRSVCPV